MRVLAFYLVAIAGGALLGLIVALTVAAIVH